MVARIPPGPSCPIDLVTLRSIIETPVDDWEWVNNVNLRAPYLLAQALERALQDGAGFVFDDYRQAFLLWPGSYFAYDAAGAPIRDWARGLWFLDPKLKAYKQEPGLFGAPGSSTGCMYGGVYDPVRDEIVALADDSSAPAIVRWNVTTFAKRSMAFQVPGKPAHTAAYFAQGRYARIGRRVYVVGYITDGAAMRDPLLLEVDLDASTVRRCADPPVPDAGMPVKVFEIRLAASRGKVVWPRVAGPDGEIDGIAIYDPARDAWTVDRQVPGYGAFICNAITELRDGRVAMCGGEFGRQQTHLWLYGAAP